MTTTPMGPHAALLDDDGYRRISDELGHPTPTASQKPKEKATMKKFPKHYRQGDVLIIEAKALPADAEPVAREGGRVILAHGELTGHAHAIKAPTVTHHVKDGRHYFAVVGEAPAALEHEEHRTISFEPGKVFRHARQVEYSPAALRNVAD
jgi:hypothetical protein